jgi:hypothetical protein
MGEHLVGHFVCLLGGNLADSANSFCILCFLLHYILYTVLILYKERPSHRIQPLHRLHHEHALDCAHAKDGEARWRQHVGH